MAQVVADGSSVGDIPEAPINMLRDVVSLRKGCAEFYRAAAFKFKSGRLAKANSTHNHMVSVLEQMLNKLEAKVCRQPKPSPSAASEPQQFTPEREVAQSAKTLATKNLGSIFENLKVFPVHHDTPENSESEEDLVNATWRSHTAGRPRKTKSKKGKKKHASSPTNHAVCNVEFNDEGAQDEFDSYMVIYCLFEDFNKIRDHVIEKWCDYYYMDSHIHLETLAAITNAAYEIFQRMQEELENHPANASPNTNFKSFTWIISTLLASEMKEGESFVAIEEGNSFPNHNVRFGPAVLKVHVCTTDIISGKAKKTIKECDFTDEENRRLALRPWAIMRSFFGHGRPLDDIPTLCPEHREFSHLYGRTDPDSLFDHDWYTSQDFSQDLSLLRLLKVDGRLDYLLPAEPELNLEFQDAFRRQNYRIHDTVGFLFSLQLFVDVRSTLDNVACGTFHKMTTTARRVHAVLVRHLKHIQPNPNPTPHNQELMRIITRRIYELNAYLIRDPIHPPDYNYKRTESPDRFHLLRRDPVWAGLLSLRAQMVAAKLGREACEAPGGLEIVEAGATVYVAAMAAFPHSIPVWRTMEMWLKSGKGHVKKACSCCGGGPLARAAGVLRGFKKASAKESNRPARSRGGFEVMWERYGETFRAEGRHLGYLEEMTQLGCGGDGGGDEEGSVDSKESSAGCSTSSETSGSERDTRLSPIEMLEVLEKSVESGFDGELDMDYFELFDGSVRMLKALVNTGLGKKYGLKAALRDSYDVEGLADVVFPLARAAQDPKERKRVVQAMVKIVSRALDDMFCDKEMEEVQEEKECALDYEEEFPGKLPPKTRVVVRKTGRWARGWGDTDWKIVNQVGPQPGDATVNDELRDKFWSTHELSEKYDRFMEPRKI